ncbi:Ycf34 family protein [Synechococcus sp. CCY 9618]|uniref:Ycf34 family protein n=1 Tax=Synechococcus sp. CCY 9618 TaxID=2815602 RepID=UPI001C22C665|nr:Ycf34 family protein [Synechococcus sp. CCY 9618]
MCICVDCHWVERCQAYHAVERQHGVAHLNSHPDFRPRQPRIHVQVMDLDGDGRGDLGGTGGVGVEWDVRACSDFRSDTGRWRRWRPEGALPT